MIVWLVHSTKLKLDSQCLSVLFLNRAFIYKLLRLIHSKNWTTDVQKDANLFLVHTILNEKRFDTFMKKILKA